MFLEASRYAKIETVETTTRDGRPVTALKLRPLGAPASAPYSVLDNDRLDLLAYNYRGDGTKFWEIADANTALQASDLTTETGANVNIPTS